MTPVFRPSLPAEANTLSEIAIRSKGHWGHPQELLDLWREGLRIEPAYISKNTLRSLQIGKQSIGFFAIAEGSPHMLDHLWILPEFIGFGYGKLALLEIKKICRERSIPSLTIISDPDAEGFYLHHGAIRIGEHPSIPQNRLLPKLRLDID